MRHWGRRPARSRCGRSRASTRAPGVHSAAAQYRAPGADARGADPGATSHHVGPELLLALAHELYGTAPEAHVVSVGVADMGPGEMLTPVVAAALCAAGDAVAALVAAHKAARRG